MSFTKFDNGSLESLTDFILIKFIDDEYINSFMDGYIYFPLIEKFHIADDDDNPATDDMEGMIVAALEIKSKTNQNETTEVALGLADPFNSAHIPICCFAFASQFSDDDFICIHDDVDTSVYRFSDSFINDLLYGSNTHSVGISKSRPFILCSFKDFKSKLNNSYIISKENTIESEINSGVVQYVNYCNPSYYSGSILNICEVDLKLSKEISVLHKDLSFKHQHELRFYIKQRYFEDVKVLVAPLSDITKIYSADTKLEDFTFTYDRKAPKFTVNPPKETK